MLFAASQSLFPAWLEIGKVSAGMSIQPLLAPRPCRVLNQPKVSLTFCCSQEGKAKQAKTSPNRLRLHGELWELGGRRGRKGVGERDRPTKGARSVPGDGARPSPCPRLTQEKANN